MSAWCASRCVQVRALLHALAQFASALLRSRRLQELNTALNAKPLSELLAYYAPRPELARYTLEQELSRMEYRVRTPPDRLLSAALCKASPVIAACECLCASASAFASALAAASLDDFLSLALPQSPLAARRFVQVRTADGVELTSAEAIREHYDSLDETSRLGLLWRLANQSLLSDLIGELHAQVRRRLPIARLGGLSLLDA